MNVDSSTTTRYNTRSRKKVLEDTTNLFLDSINDRPKRGKRKAKTTKKEKKGKISPSFLQSTKQQDPETDDYTESSQSQLFTELSEKGTHSHIHTVNEDSSFSNFSVSSYKSYNENDFYQKLREKNLDIPNILSDLRCQWQNITDIFTQKLGSQNVAFKSLLNFYSEIHDIPFKQFVESGFSFEKCKLMTKDLSSTNFEPKTPKSKKYECSNRKKTNKKPTNFLDEYTNQNSTNQTTNLNIPNIMINEVRFNAKSPNEHTCTGANTTQHLIPKTPHQPRNRREEEINYCYEHVPDAILSFFDESSPTSALSMQTYLREVGILKTAGRLVTKKTANMAKMRNNNTKKDDDTDERYFGQFGKKTPMSKPTVVQHIKTQNSVLKKNLRNNHNNMNNVNYAIVM